jgi:formylglycine-generating enzyme required for sulfatase activity
VVVRIAAGVAGALAVGASLVACGALIGIDDPHVVPAGDPDGSVDAAGGADTASPASDADAGDRAVDGADAAPLPPPSCQAAGAGRTDCGPRGDESCCASPLVDGGTFYRSYDGVSYTSMMDPATVSPFRLDRFEVTVGRFRQFVDRVVAGWVPPAGSGTHAYLNRGSGLNGAEQGWQKAWDANLSTTPAAWDTNLVTTCPTAPTWTGSADLPINCITWYEAYAFCIWDDGFLPSEAEWNFAAAGGDDQRVYPWTTAPMSTAIACTDANYQNVPTCGTSPWKGGTASPAGDGRWGQADLAGNVREWVLDSSAAYIDPCNDCAFIAPNSLLVTRGGSFADPAMFVLGAYRTEDSPVYRDSGIGVRCGRAPLGP